MVDPSQRVDRIADLWIDGGRIAAILGPKDPSPAGEDLSLDARDCVVAPGLIDLHVHLREPGQTDKEDIASGTAAAVAGGFTSVLCMPNTEPANDTVEVTRQILARARETAACRVHPVGALTKGLRGAEVAPIEELRAAGCIAFSDDGRPVNDARVLREAMGRVKGCDAVLMEHCEELSLSGEPKVHDGAVARELGLAGLPRSVETLDVVRTLTLAAETGVRVHLAHLSCASSVDLVREFKKRLPGVTAEATPHHLLLTHEALRHHGTNAKMYPPLREAPDREALVGGLFDGTIDAVATDHAPHTAAEKARPFAEAPCGVTGLETALRVMLRLVAEGALPLPLLIERMSTGPARIAGLPGGTLAVGAPADVVVFRPEGDGAIGANDLRSRSKNSPWIGFKGVGRVAWTLVGGRVAFEGETA